MLTAVVQNQRFAEDRTLQALLDLTSTADEYLDFGGNADVSKRFVLHYEIDPTAHVGYNMEGQMVERCCSYTTCHGERLKLWNL